MNRVDQYRKQINEIFGFSLRNEQEKTLINLDKKNVISIMPTGSGKSMTYLLPVSMGSRTLVISPLKALIEDQYQSAKEFGLNPVFINSSLNATERRLNLEKFKSRKSNLLFVSPERFENKEFLNEILKINVDLFAIDEAHCISDWGNDFRPSYLNLGNVRKILKPKRTLALTATANVNVIEDIKNKLFFGNNDSISLTFSFNRKNLKFHNISALNEKNQDEIIVNLISNNDAGSHIIYCRTRKITEETSEYLNLKGIKSAFFHAGLSEKEKIKIQNQFRNDDLKTIVATTAFGMGIDKPDVRIVIVKGIPKNIEEYYQQCGRAGRDGNESNCYLVSLDKDYNREKMRIERSFPKKEELFDIWEGLLDYLKNNKDKFNMRDLEKLFFKYSYGSSNPKLILSLNSFINSKLIESNTYKLIEYSKFPKINYSYIAEREKNAKYELYDIEELRTTKLCIREKVLNYFKENYICIGENCCDYEKKLSPLIKELNNLNKEITNSNLKISYSTLKDIEKYPPRNIKELERIRGLGETKIRLFGEKIIKIVKMYKDNIHKENAHKDSDMNNSSYKIINPKKTPSVSGDFSSRKISKENINISEGVKEININYEIYNNLKDLRSRISKERNVSAYIIFNNEVLDNLVELKPKSLDDLSKVKGMGKHKIENYGKGILKVIEDGLIS